MKAHSLSAETVKFLDLMSYEINNISQTALEVGEKLLVEKRVLRVITSSFPKYFAIVSRPIENSTLIGADGGNIQSTVVDGARAFFPNGALTKRIAIALQV